MPTGVACQSCEVYCDGQPNGNAQAIFDCNATTERRIIEAVDLEKQRFADELHENLCQFLVGISLLGNALDEELLRLNLSQSQDARQITNMAKDAVLQVRGLVKQLSPMPLGHGEGLIPALEDLAEQARSASKIKCSFHAPLAGYSMEPVVAMHLYRIAQEAVYNSIKHANAKRLSIRFSASRGKIVLTVRDNGIGFTPRPDSSSGIGLRLMHSRARAIRATLEFRKLPIRGTAVICTLPK
jgi:signal transduction histidine kinase